MLGCIKYSNRLIGRFIDGIASAPLPFSLSFASESGELVVSGPGLGARALVAGGLLWGAHTPGVGEGSVDR